MTNASSMSPQTKRLPDSWVQRIFSTMQGHYGTRFLNMWKTGQIMPDGSDAGIVNAMNHWAEKLGGFTDHPETIKKALSVLPPEPPTLPQFHELLRHVHVPNNGHQLEHKLTPEQMAENKRRVADLLASLKK